MLFKLGCRIFRPFSGRRIGFGSALTLGGCKILHELGHALMCKHYGGRCHELGLMLLVFTPCLYVNVSDAWMLPSKWQRMAVERRRHGRRTCAGRDRGLGLVVQ